MRDSLASLAVGIAVGIFYGMLRVRSPAPPVIALVGLAGMLVGEYAVRQVRQRHEVSAPRVAVALDRRR